MCMFQSDPMLWNCVRNHGPSSIKTHSVCFFSNCLWIEGRTVTDMGTNIRTYGRTDRLTDEHPLVWRCNEASKKG